MGILTILFYFFVFIAFPLGEIARIEFGNGVAFTLLDIAVFLLAGTLLIGSTKFRAKLTKPLVLFIAIGLISLLINVIWLPFQQFIPAFLYWVRFVAYAGLYIVVARLDLSTKKKFLSIVLFSGLIIIVLGFIQYFLYPYLGNLRYLGWDDHLFRLFSSFLDPNFAGAFFVLYFFLVLFYLKKAFVEKNNMHIFLYFFLSVTVLISLILTYSRTAYIMLLVGLIALLFVQRKYKRYLGLGIITILFIGFGVILANRRLEVTNFFRTASTVARFESAQGALKIFTNNPILGVGFNTYRYAQYRYGFVSGSRWQTSHGASTTDNSWLFVLATTGIVGFVAYGYLWYCLVKEALRRRSYQTFLIPTLISLAIGSFFNDLLFYTPLLAWMWILIGLTENS